MTTSNSKIDVILFCMNCDGDTVHEIEYKNDKMHRIVCRNCGLAIQVNQEYVTKHYKEDFVSRVLSKPARMTEEMADDLNGFLWSLPHRVVTKPYRMLREHSERDEGE